MSNFIKAVFLSLTVALLAGCDTEPKFDTDLSASTNEKTNVALEEMRGDVVHKAVYSTEILSKSTKLGEGIYSYAFLIKSQSREMAGFSFTCVIDMGGMAVVHTVLKDNGQKVTGEQTFSIMKYRKGIKDIREVDESSKPLFSLANGDVDFISALGKIKDLDKDTPVAFTIETPEDDGMSYTVAWTPLMRAGDLAAAISKLPLKACEGIPLAVGDPEVVVGSTNQEMAEYMKGRQ